ncbi:MULTISPECIES: DoxX family membrane protein [unclassified Microbacterium]|uniref:DoxX family membrane protein n=1 Tax=unclassified Microbacterium TaxID=2609290 RepID=UPI001604E3AD|nr:MULTISPECIES: TQO small subunit DoxD [unclassified Microbacterium]QNA93796.1 DoxX family membrane protein [Microbacterium sp. Se63.02b]QYM64091.1 DoxX family membrane protein [Microbacterium sp. Se5.02b]
MTGSRPAGPLIGSVLGGGARVAVGVLWLNEGFVKYRAGFGAADIALVTGSTEENPRVPWFFAPVGSFMQTAPGLFGVVMPALEVALGLLLVAGLLTRIAAFVSIGTLMLYWSADQLIAAYPAMVVLCAVVLLLPAAGRFGVDGWLRRRRRVSA